MTIPPSLAASLNDGEPVPPRPSASVLVADAASQPWRVLMMRRPGGADFAPGAHVFPGGALHEGDLELADPIRATGLRELFEEVGLLLVRGQGRLVGDAECRRLREELGHGAGFWETLAGMGLEPAFDLLTFCTRWITPEGLPRRYDTHFFVAPAPAGQEVHPEPDEVVEWCWISPEAALVDPHLELVHVTRRILELVAPAPDPRELVDRLRRRGEIPPITPRLVERAGGGMLAVDDARPLFGPGDEE